MLVDDPVKRVDNMTMAWGLEARVPFLDHEVVELAGRIPPELKLADGGKGVLKRASRGRGAGRGDRPDQGLLPGAGDPAARGPVPGPGAGGAQRPGGAAPRAVPAETVRGLLADPNATRTTLGSNALWQLALLEMWLQTHDVN
jgi:asparagine synthase (glutamine-hydrolysing)